jgi:hypothetical protein
MSDRTKEDELADQLYDELTARFEKLPVMVVAWVLVDHLALATFLLYPDRKQRKEKLAEMVEYIESIIEKRTEGNLQDTPKGVQ